jgi:hypothetical protein
MIKPEVL